MLIAEQLYVPESLPQICLHERGEKQIVNQCLASQTDEQLAVMLGTARSFLTAGTNYCKIPKVPLLNPEDK